MADRVELGFKSDAVAATYRDFERSLANGAQAVRTGIGRIAATCVRAWEVISSPSASDRASADKDMAHVAMSTIDPVSLV